MPSTRRAMRAVGVLLSCALALAADHARADVPPPQRLDLRFPCGDVRCAAWLYLPAGVERPPLVVMAHGFGGTRALFLPRFAERFAARGLAVLVFDYRRFGDSEGEPRQLISIDDQLADWQAALAYARTLGQVDPSRIGLWGTSFGGGHVLVTAADAPDVRAVVALVPFVDGEAGERLGFRYGVRALCAALRDRTQRALGFAPHYVPVLGAPGTFAVINTAQAYAAYRELVPPQAGWRNEVAAGVLLSLGGYRPALRVPEIRAPLLVIAAHDDELVPIERVAEVVRGAVHGRLREFSGGHFGAYGGVLFAELVEEQAEFLAESLR
jgi:uncharacterized protein